MKLPWRRDRNVIIWPGMIVNQSRWWIITKEIMFDLSIIGLIGFIIFGHSIDKEDISEKAINNFRNIDWGHFFK